MENHKNGSETEISMDVKRSMPSELVEESFAALANDKSLSYKMRAKFKAAIGEGRCFEEDWL